MQRRLPSLVLGERVALTAMRAAPLVLAVTVRFQEAGPQAVPVPVPMAGPEVTRFPQRMGVVVVVAPRAAAAAAAAK
jgi:hypothetical protein